MKKLILALLFLAACGNENSGEGVNQWVNNSPVIQAITASNDLYLGAEAWLYPPYHGVAELRSREIQLPQNQSVGLEATVSMTTKGCPNDTTYSEVMMQFEIDGLRYFPVIVKTKEQGSVNVFVTYSPVNYGEGKAMMIIAGDGCNLDWEIQGRLIVEPQS